MTGDTREGAVQRLEAALIEQDRLDGRFRAAVGTSSEFGAYARLRGGRKDVAARQAWLNRVDEDVATTARAKKMTVTTSDAHDAAVVRLETALVEQTRSGGRYRSALGTTNELGAYVRLQGASDEVSARQAWLDRVDAHFDAHLDDGGRVVVNGREVGGAGSIFTGA